MRWCSACAWSAPDDTGPQTDRAVDSGAPVATRVLLHLLGGDLRERLEGAGGHRGVVDDDDVADALAVAGQDAAGVVRARGERRGRRDREGVVAEAEGLALVEGGRRTRVGLGVGRALLDVLRVRGHV